MAIKSSRHDPEGLHPGRRHHWARSNGSGCGQFGALDDLTPRAWHCMREQVAQHKFTPPPARRQDPSL